MPPSPPATTGAPRAITVARPLIWASVRELDGSATAIETLYRGAVPPTLRLPAYAAYVARRLSPQCAGPDRRQRRRTSLTWYAPVSALLEAFPGRVASAGERQAVRDQLDHCLHCLTEGTLRIRLLRPEAGPLPVDALGLTLYHRPAPAEALFTVDRGGSVGVVAASSLETARARLERARHHAYEPLVAARLLADRRTRLPRP
ncbi:Scr1 family TA system antitoxin-like transcriptional regulator [Streptomyces sp. NPDC058373]|uniref:Scr1 family TA system antitoxin-like transcriptional regulator n=1 Tax=unclassified Streptomyces TaxID=2593676 RepID=UPI003661C7F6